MSNLRWVISTNGMNGWESHVCTSEEEALRDIKTYLLEGFEPEDIEVIVGCRYEFTANIQKEINVSKVKIGEPI